MDQSRYTSAMLTVNALLLGALVLVKMSSGGGAVQTATAAPGIPNAAQQRQVIIDRIDELTERAEDTNKLIKSGKLRVTVANLDDAGRRR
ncbi:MAG: hypothetical protein AAF432_02580 [Planctomycetota bacterium]